MSSLKTKEANETEYTVIPLEKRILRIFSDIYGSQSFGPYDLMSLEQIADLGDRIMMTAQKSSQKFFEETKGLERPSGMFRIEKGYCNPLSIGVLLKTSDEKLFFVRFYLHPNGKYIDKENNTISEIEAVEYKLTESGIECKNLKTMGIVFDSIKQPCVVLTAELNLASKEVNNSKESLDKFIEPQTSPFYLGAMELYKKL